MTAPLCVLAAGVVLLAPAHGAVISWGSATSISGASDVSTNGSLVEAYNASAGGNLTINGVTFVATDGLLDQGAASGLFSGSTGDLNYDALLNSVDFGGGDSTTLVIGDGDGDTTTLGAGLLSMGSVYEIQVWFMDDRTSQDSRTMGFASSSGDPVVQLNDQYVIGTFTADGSTQTLFLDTVSPSSGFGNTHITAYQIRLIPEPSVAVMMLLGLGFLLRRRRG